MSKTGLSLLIVLAFLGSCKEKSKRQRQADVVEKDSFYNEKRKFKPFSQSFIDSLEKFFEPGFSGTVLVYRKGHLYEKAFGYRDIGRKDEMQMDDVFQLASVSKTVTATAVMILKERGKIDIEKPVVHYLEDFPYPGVTIRQLLNHRSGLANYIYYTDTFWKDTSAHMTSAMFYDFMLKSKPDPYLKPDVSFSYCNTNYAFLAILIEKVSGMSFPRFVEENIFKPAGMKHSFFKGNQPERIKSTVLTGRYDRHVYNGTYYLDGVLGDKSMYSNAEDLFHFHLALNEGRLISKKSLKEMEKPSYKYNVYGGSYGLGFRLMNTKRGQWTYHNGWWRGFWTSFWNKFDKNTCFIILTNNKQSSHVNKLSFGDYILRKGK